MEKALNVGPSRIEIAYECFGEPDAPPVLLLMGVGVQMLGWHEGFCAELASRGLRPIRFDNRDVGLSTHFSDAPLPDLKAARSGDTSSAAYNLSDMAADTVGLLDALGITSAHLVGASMGGFIAQMVAVEHPERVRSMTSMMASTGSPTVGQPKPEAMQLFSSPPPGNRDEVMEQAVKFFRVIGSPGFPVDENEVRERAGRAYDRAYDPPGAMRQAVAVITTGDRTARLSSIKAPTQVIHGADDCICDVSGGVATAEAINGAKLFVIEGMGHNLPRGLWPRIASLIAEHVQRAEANTSQ